MHRCCKPQRRRSSGYLDSSVVSLSCSDELFLILLAVACFLFAFSAPLISSVQLLAQGKKKNFLSFSLGRCCSHLTSHAQPSSGIRVPPHWLSQLRACLLSFDLITSLTHPLTATTLSSCSSMCTPPSFLSLHVSINGWKRYAMWTAWRSVLPFLQPPLRRNHRPHCACNGWSGAHYSAGLVADAQAGQVVGRLGVGV